MAPGTSSPPAVHWKASVTPSSQIPVAAISDWPTCGVPLMVGVGVLTSPPMATAAVGADSLVTVV